MTFKKSLFAGLAALALLVAAPIAASAEDHWGGPHMAISASGYNVYYGEGYDQQNARDEAKSFCQDNEPRDTCDDGKSVPLNEGWNIAVLACSDGAFLYDFEGASQFGTEWTYAWDRANYKRFRASDCRSITSDDWVYPDDY